MVKWLISSFPNSLSFWNYQKIPWDQTLSPLYLSFKS